jgi:pimeloyl-ACP methyl ester carboxylesterase
VGVSAILAVVLAVGAGTSIDLRFAEVAPARAVTAPWVRTLGARRAVLLIHGLKVHVFQDRAPYQAKFDSWQGSGSRLVKGLAPLADIFAAAYSQNAAVEDIAADPRWLGCIASIRAMGYSEIVLVGHSAGGIIARELVEDHPDCGCTKVVQVCSPNAGSSWANLYPAVVEGEVLFTHSLTKAERQRVTDGRSDRRIPSDLEFVCIVGNAEFYGDGLVSCGCQWPPDLQSQGMPARVVATAHPLAVRSAAGVTEIIQAVREQAPRWTAAQVAQARKRLLQKTEQSPRR